MVRGVGKTNIFRNNKDREDFIERLANLCPEMGMTCYAWAFMPNHAHFLFKTGQNPLSKFMRRILTGYVIGFNSKAGRSLII
jgi:REP element-mobilizing transposase RayT